MATIDDIRAKLLANQQKNDSGSRNQGDQASFPFWNTPDGKTTLLRFLPDEDPNNTFFWVERTIIKIPFQGIKGESDRPVEVQVPCMDMYGEADPIIAETKPWWNDPSLANLARRYWKKRSYLFQGFVVSSDFKEENPPENPIRRFMINSSIYDIIKSSLMDPEMENLPIDYTLGRDFKLVKTANGQYASYNTSSWSMKTRELSSTELAAIEQHGLFNLKDYLPKKPNEEEKAAIMEMFHASVNEEAYDPDRWEKFYRPFGLNRNGDDKPAFKAKAPVVTPTPAPASAAPVPSAASKNDASEILKRLRQKQQGN